MPATPPLLFSPVSFFIVLQTCFSLFVLETSCSFQATHLGGRKPAQSFRGLYQAARQGMLNPLRQKKYGCNRLQLNDGQDAVSSDVEFKEEPLVLSDWACPKTNETLHASTLDGRLLCAAECAYGIDEASPYFRSAAFLPGTTVKRITRGVNSVIVGRTVDGIVVSFRGTVANSPLDWLQNAALFLASPGGGIDGKVHIGFFSAVRALWKPLKAAIKENLSTRESRIYLTGHSKGGALASIAATLMRKDPEIPDPHYVCSFATPKVGNGDFAATYNRDIRQTSYEAYFDLVPLLPPSRNMMENVGEEMTEMIDDIMWSDEERKRSKGYTWEYEAVGTRKYINEFNRVVFPVTNEVDDERIREFEKETLLSFAKFRAAHCPGCPEDKCDGRYFKGVAASVCVDC